MELLLVFSSLFIVSVGVVTDDELFEFVGEVDKNNDDDGVVVVGDIILDSSGNTDNDSVKKFNDFVNETIHLHKSIHLGRKQ